MKRRLYPVVKFGARVALEIMVVTAVSFVLFAAVVVTSKKGDPGPLLSDFLYLYRSNSALTLVIGITAWFTLMASVIKGNSARERGLTADQAAPKLSAAKAPSRLLTGGGDGAG